MFQPICQKLHPLHRDVSRADVKPLGGRHSLLQLLGLTDKRLEDIKSDLKPLTIWCQEFAGTEWDFNLQTLR